MDELLIEMIILCNFINLKYLLNGNKFEFNMDVNTISCLRISDVQSFDLNVRLILFDSSSTGQWPFNLYGESGLCHHKSKFKLF